MRLDYRVSLWKHHQFAHCRPCWPYASACCWLYRCHHGSCWRMHHRQYLPTHGFAKRGWGSCLLSLLAHGLLFIDFRCHLLHLCIRDISNSPARKGPRSIRLWSFCCDHHILTMCTNCLCSYWLEVLPSLHRLYHRGRHFHMVLLSRGKMSSCLAPY